LNAVTHDLTAHWLNAVAAAGLRQPDAERVSVNQGHATAAGQYKAARALVFVESIDTETSNMLKDKGWMVLDFSDESRWEVLFSAHSDVFGSS
jgi:hypothetical protein